MNVGEEHGDGEVWIGLGVNVHGMSMETVCSFVIVEWN